MIIEIKYNEEIDEFTKDLCLETRIQKYINKHFYPALILAKLCPVYLLGGAIRDLILAKHPKDLDFVILGKEHLDWVLKVIEKFNIEYETNRLGGFKFTYENTKIDLWLSEDLFSNIEYNVDGLFYDLKSRSLISLTFEDFRINNLRKVNEENNIEKGRKLKLMDFASKYQKKL